MWKNPSFQVSHLAQKYRWILLFLMILLGFQGILWGTEVIFLERISRICLNCQFKLDSVELSPRGLVGVVGVNFDLAIDNKSKVSGQIEAIQIDLDYLSLFGDTLTINRVVFLSPAFQVLEVASSDDLSEEMGPLRQDKGLPPIRVEKIELKNGKFSYTYKDHLGQGTLSLDQIEIRLNEIISAKHLVRAPLRFQLHAHLEKNGKVEINGTLHPFSDHQPNLLSIQLKNQNLKHLNSFFEEESGVQLTGKIHTLWANLEIQNGRASGELEGSYSDLDIHFENDNRRTGFSAFFQSLVSDLTVRSTQKKGAKVEVPLTHKKANQSVFNFILDALQPAFLALIQSH